MEVQCLGPTEDGGQGKTKLVVNSTASIDNDSREKDMAEEKSSQSHEGVCKDDGWPPNVVGEH